MSACPWKVPWLPSCGKNARNVAKLIGLLKYDDIIYAKNGWERPLDQSRLGPEMIALLDKPSFIKITCTSKLRRCIIVQGLAC